MKNKFCKIAGLVLSAVLLIGAVVGISISAADENAPEIIAQNLVYGEKISVAYAVKADVSDAISGAVGVSYYWSDETAENAKKAVLLDPSVSTNLFEGKYPVFVTEGVPAKDLDKVAFASVKIGDVAPTEYAHSYSGVQYLYTRLYKNGFATKTEADGLDFQRRGLYESLLEYGSFAQSVLINGKTETVDDDVTLIRDYSYAYTLTEGVTLNGKTAVLGADTIEVNAAYTGEGTLAGWILTDKDGVETEVESSTFTVNGVALIAPKFGVHTCVDSDNDHLCDTCNEPASECKNENSDHLCDICGKVVSSCADATADGKCDVCSKYIFTDKIDSYGAGSGITAHIVGWNGTANQETSFSSVNTLSTANRPSGFTKGYWFNLTTNPTDAADRVIQYNMVSTNSNWDTDSKFNSDSYLLFTPTEQVADGDLIVFQFDYYQNGGNSGKTPLKYYDVFADNSIKISNGVVATLSGDIDGDGTAESCVRASQSSTASTIGWARYKSWLTIRVVYSNTDHKAYYYTSNDGGVTFDYLKAISYGVESDLAQVGFYADYVWQCGATMYIDNVLCVKTTEAAFGIDLP